MTRCRGAVAWLCLWAAASAAGADSPARGPLTRLRANPRYFTDGSGRAVYLTGSHTWANFATDQGLHDPPVAFDYSGYLDFLVAHRHNFFRAWLWELPRAVEGSNGGPFYFSPLAWLRTGPGLATDGKPKFDVSRPDAAYFARIRARTIAARDRGIYVAIMLFQGYSLQFNRTATDGYPLDGRNNINGVDAGPGHAANTLENPAVTARQEEYVRNLIDAVNDLDNVLYEISNEAGPYATAWQYHFIDFIHAYERTKPRQHPVGMTFQYRGGTIEELFASPADWISPDCGRGYLRDPLAADGRKVMVIDTDHGYGGDRLRKDGPAVQQQWVWKNLMRGNQTLFMDPYLARIQGRNEPAGVNPSDEYFGLRPDPSWETLRVAMGRARIWADKVDLAAMTPHGELTSAAYCLASPGREYLIYSAEGHRLSVSLAAGSYRFEWYNPSSGKSERGGSFHTSAGQRRFDPPFRGDAVLYILKRGRTTP